MGYIINPFFVAPAEVDIQDDFESYAASDPLDGKNGGTGWNGAWVSRGGSVGLIAEDNFESYTAGNSLNGLAGGTGWDAAWVSR